MGSVMLFEGCKDGNEPFSVKRREPFNDVERRRYDILGE